MTDSDGGDDSPAEAHAPLDQQESIQSSNHRALNVFLRYEGETSAMGARQRLNTKICLIFRQICCRKAEAAAVVVGISGDEEEAEITQYRLEPKTKTVPTCLQRFFCCGGKDVRPSVGVTPNQALAQYLHWMFRVNFFFLFLLSCVVFFGLTVLFAGFIVWAGHLDPSCVRVGGEPFEIGKTSFLDAFALSWTTFSTSGYGNAYPALGNQNDNPNNCVFITGLCSLESFIGVLYSGFCGAILFGKVLRIQSHAQVMFSDPIVIRYGSGVELPDEGRGTCAEPTKDQTRKNNIPCPVLEFRIINRLFNDVGGEIMDASISAVANVDADDADPSLRYSVDRYRMGLLPPSLEASSVTDTNSDPAYDTSESGRNSTRSLFSNPRSQVKYLDPRKYLFSKKRDNQAIDEDPSARFIGKRIYSKMHIEASEHPFFKRVWLARHVLDGTSPLLTHKTRRAIRRNGGFWPSHLNNYEAVRNCLRFNQILVSFKGVSNVSAADVYAQKIYDVVDVNIGYQFVNVLYRDGRDGSLKVDTTLINDVREQNGGGGEPLLLGQ